MLYSGLLTELLIQPSLHHGSDGRSYLERKEDSTAQARARGWQVCLSFSIMSSTLKVWSLTATTLSTLMDLIIESLPNNKVDMQATRPHTLHSEGRE